MESNETYLQPAEYEAVASTYYFDRHAQNREAKVLQERNIALRCKLTDKNSDIPPEKAKKLGTILDCLEYSSVSPDLFQQLATIVDTIAQTSVSKEKIEEHFNSVEIIKKQMDNTRQQLSDQMASITTKIPDIVDRQILNYVEIFKKTILDQMEMIVLAKMANKPQHIRQPFF